VDPQGRLGAVVAGVWCCAGRLRRVLRVLLLSIGLHAAVKYDRHTAVWGAGRATWRAVVLMGRPLLCVVLVVLAGCMAMCLWG
jgi:hypothetical protein